MQLLLLLHSYAVGINTLDGLDVDRNVLSAGIAQW